MVKYCQECGNASYDSAPICGNCGAKLPPKSEANATPPSSKKKAQGPIQSISIFGEVKTEKTVSPKSEDFNIGGALNRFSNKLGNAIDKFDSKEEIKDKKRVEEEKVIERQTSSKPSFSQTATIGFKEKDKGTKNPAKKYNALKEESDEEIPKKEVKVKAKKEKKTEIKPNIKKPKETSKESRFGNLNFKHIAIIVVIALIILAIAGIGISNMQSQPTDEIKNYTSGAMSFNYSGNWSEYNNKNDDAASTDLAFKTRDNTLIGFSTIQSDEITYEMIGDDINATAQSLNGSIIQANNIDLGDQNITGADYIINTSNQGYSRYICLLEDGVYYSFVINNGKSDNKDLSALNTTEIQYMLSSIHLSNYVPDEESY